MGISVTKRRILAATASALICYMCGRYVRGIRQLVVPQLQEYYDVAASSFSYATPAADYDPPVPVVVEVPPEQQGGGRGGGSILPSPEAAAAGDAGPAGVGGGGATNGAADDNDGGDSFSACLLVQDENPVRYSLWPLSPGCDGSPLPHGALSLVFSPILFQRLPEWLGYSYYALPLRWVVVAVDPRSRTSPTEILEKWRARTDMRIFEWSDADIVSHLSTRATNATTATPLIDPAAASAAEIARNESLLAKIAPYPGDDDRTLTSKHRLRQGLFYQACTRFLKQRGRSWTAYVDIDEYVTLNYDVLHNSTHSDFQRRSGSILRMVKALSNSSSGGNNGDEDERPVVAASSTTNTRFWYSHFQKSSCVTLSRGTISAYESTADEVARDMPKFVDPSRLDTLRFRYRASPRKNKDGPAKSIVDVSRVDLDADFSEGYSPHRVLKGACPNAFIAFKRLPVAVYHYLGSWESYAYRKNDPRFGQGDHTYEKWANFANRSAGGPDDYLRPWVRGFAGLVGESNAKYLLQNAGLSTDYTKTWNATASSSNRI